MRTFCTTLLLLGLTPMAQAAEIESPSVLTAVEVYGDRARVVRSATVDVVPGSHEVVLTGLPPQLEVESLRAEGEGTARVVLGSIDVRRGFRPEALSERVRDLQGRIEGLQDTDRELADAAGAADFQIAYLRSLSAKSGAQIAERTLELKGLSAEVGAMSDALLTRLSAAQAEQRRVVIARRTVTRQIDALQKELAQLQSGAQTEDLRCAIAIEAKTAGKVTVRVSYTATWASWAPTYDARFDAETGAVSLTYGAWVTQGTGEDWSGVSLSLSTAQPDLGIAPPRLDPWVLAVEPPYVARTRSTAMGAAAPMAKSAPREEGIYDEMADAPQLAMEVAEAVIETGGPAVRFGVPGVVHVPGDGTRKRVTIAQWTLDKATLERVAAPALSEHVFLTAKARNDKDFPLLPGELQAFYGDRYVGASALERVAPGEDFAVPFGVDDKVKVTRKVVSREEGKKNLFSGKDALAVTWKTTVESFHKSAVDVIIADRIPVSELEKVEVKVGSSTPAPTEKKDRGIWTWSVSVKPGQKVDLPLELVIAFPPDQRPWNLP